jgi:pectinesterase
MKGSALVCPLVVASFVPVARGETASPIVARFPANGARDVNPDTHLVLTFAREPAIGTSGKIRVYDAANDASSTAWT